MDLVSHSCLPSIICVLQYICLRRRMGYSQITFVLGGRLAPKHRYELARPTGRTQINKARPMNIHIHLKFRRTTWAQFRWYKVVKHGHLSSPQANPLDDLIVESSTRGSIRRKQSTTTSELLLLRSCLSTKYTQAKSVIQKHHGLHDRCKLHD